jgi:hypothetical protein
MVYLMFIALCSALGESAGGEAWKPPSNQPCTSLREEVRASDRLTDPSLPGPGTTRYQG